jgi:hypothetical protein
MVDDVATDREATIDATETNRSTMNSDNEAPEKTTTLKSVATDTNTNMDIPHSKPWAEGKEDPSQREG